MVYTDYAHHQKYIHTNESPTIIVECGCNNNGDYYVHLYSEGWSGSSSFGFSFNIEVNSTSVISMNGLGPGTNVERTGHISTNTFTCKVICGDDGCANGASHLHGGYTIGPWTLKKKPTNCTRDLETSTTCSVGVKNINANPSNCGSVGIWIYLEEGKYGAETLREYRQNYSLALTKSGLVHNTTYKYWIRYYWDWPAGVNAVANHHLNENYPYAVDIKGTLSTFPLSISLIGQTINMTSIAIKYSTTIKSGGAVDCGTDSNYSNMQSQSVSTGTQPSFTMSNLQPYTDYTIYARVKDGTNTIETSNTFKTLYPFVRVWNGSSWNKAMPYVWDGSAWKLTTAHIWNGSQWKGMNNE